MNEGRVLWCIRKQNRNPGEKLSGRFRSEEEHLTLIWTGEQRVMGCVHTWPPWPYQGLDPRCNQAHHEQAWRRWYSSPSPHRMAKSSGQNCRRSIWEQHVEGSDPDGNPRSWDRVFVTQAFLLMACVQAGSGWPFVQCIGKGVPTLTGGLDLKPLSFPTLKTHFILSIRKNGSSEWKAASECSLLLSKVRRLSLFTKHGDAEPAPETMWNENYAVSVFSTPIEATARIAINLSCLLKIF